MEQASTVKRLTSRQFAEKNMVQIATVITRLCRTGSYFGVRPLKLANRRLAWPDVFVEVGSSADDE